MDKKKEVVFKTFHDIDIPVLRAWNQLHFALNLEESHGERVSSRYFEFLSEEERVNLMLVATRIVVKGRDFVQKEVMAEQGK